MPVLVTLNAADEPLPPVNATVLYTTVCAGAVPKTEIVWIAPPPVTAVTLMFA